MNSILFPIKWINNFFLIFFQTIILINKIISSYLFNHKNLIIFLKLYLFLNKKIIFNLFYELWGVTTLVNCTT